MADDISASEPDAGPPPAPILDLSRLMEVTDGDEEFVRELLEGFAGQLSETLAESQNAWGAGDMDRLKRLAHSTAGSSGNVGANALFAVARQLEHSAAGGTRESTESGLRLFRDCVAETREAIVRQLG